MPTDDTPPVCQDDELAALLCMALDGSDETRRNLMARLALAMRDLDRETDLDRLRTHGGTTVVTL